MTCTLVKLIALPFCSENAQEDVYGTNDPHPWNLQFLLVVWEGDPDRTRDFALCLNLALPRCSPRVRIAILPPHVASFIKQFRTKCPPGVTQCNMLPASCQSRRTPQDPIISQVHSYPSCDLKTFQFSSDWVPIPLSVQLCTYQDDHKRRHVLS
ncbi:hypothetical protein BDR05DRAFT_693565 [Suillus weaverae]|nr:hypothetical protein BDR05DRAFT_693565 [Suillus weaverae]